MAIQIYCTQKYQFEQGFLRLFACQMPKYNIYLRFIKDHSFILPYFEICIDSFVIIFIKLVHLFLSHGIILSAVKSQIYYFQT